MIDGFKKICELAGTGLGKAWSPKLQMQYRIGGSSDENGGVESPPATSDSAKGGDVLHFLVGVRPLNFCLELFISAVVFSCRRIQCFIMKESQMVKT